MFRSVVFCLFLVFQAIHGQSLYRATIDMAGYKGVVEFEPNSDTVMTVSVEITAGSAPNDLTNFTVTTMPAVFGQLRNAADVCANLGSTTRILTGLSVGNTTQVSGLPVSDIFNRGLLITSTDGQTRLCGTILPVSSSVTSLKAIFIGPIVGEVWIRGISGSTGFLLISNLAYSQPLGDASSTTPLTIYDYQGGQINDDEFSSRCVSLANRGSPIASIPVGNSATASGKRAATYVSNLALSSLGSALGITNQNNNIACAYLDSIDNKTVVANVAWDNVVANFTMFQQSPFDYTLITIAATGLESSIPAGYHVHKYPVPQRLNVNEERCSGSNVGGHYNPYNVVIANSPAAGSGTADEYEIGDLSGKYGLLNASSYSANFIDWNLPLFGVHSVVGRSMVIHSPNGDRWVCATIGYPASVETAIVQFKDPAYGFMLFRQEKNKPRSDVTIFGELANMNGADSSSHNFHVHEQPVHGDCMSAGPHYDPASLAQSPVYATACSPSNPFQCEIGDLSRRHNGINIGSQLRQSNKFFFTDSFLSLSGPLSIVGRSMVVHNENAAAPRYACNNITKVHTTMVRNSENMWKGDDRDGMVRGYMTFSQVTQYDQAVVTASVTGLNSLARSYHIHILPVDEQRVGVDQCSANSVKGHFDPFGIADTPTPTSFTFDKYEVGDLSGKYGTVEDSDVISLSGIQDNLPFTTGIVSSAGRSIVIHKNDQSGTRWKCNTIDLQPGDDTGHVVTARAAFTNADVVTGFVDLRQIVYEDGFASVTTILVSLFHGNAQTTDSHNWHIHIDPVLDQTDCKQAMGHYDPHKAVETSSNYSFFCNPNNPFACEVGDLSKKQSQHSIDGKRRLYIDEDVPLHSHRTVLGRSIVFHDPNGGPGRLVCANIVPKRNSYTLAFPSHVQYDSYQFTSTVARALGIHRARVIVLHNVKIPIPGRVCSRVLITIAGNVDNQKVNDMLSDKNGDLAPYGSTTECVSQNNVEILGMEHYEPTGNAAILQQNTFLLLSCLFVAFMQKLIIST